MPPAATSGRLVRLRTSWSSDSRPNPPDESSAGSSTKLPRWPPASLPWSTSTSAPASAASAASAGVVTVTHTSLPAACRALITAGSGQPNVNEVTGMGSALSSASLASQSSSSNLGWPSSTPACRASAASSAAYSVTASCSAGPPGTNTLTPSGPRVSSLACRICSASAAAVRYPAARKPRPPALATAAASCGVVGPPASGASTIGTSR